MNRKESKRLVRQIQELQALLEDRATYFKNDEKEAQKRYKELYLEIDLKLEELGYEHENPHRSLHSIWGYSKTHDLGTYRERRQYIRDLYEDIVFDIERRIAKGKEPRNWQKANDAIDDDLAPIRTQWLKAKNFIYSEPPDYENSIKESINSIESSLKILLGEPNGTLGKLVKKADIDQDIGRVISKVYGLVSNKDFVRHGGTKKQDLTQEEAEFFLDLSATAIVYLKAKIGK